MRIVGEKSNLERLLESSENHIFKLKTDID